MLAMKLRNAAAAAALAIAPAGLSAQASSTETAPPKTIAEIAAGAGNFKTLVAALDAAGLVETLKGPGPFTVFAPTDSAFARLPAGTVDGLLADKPQLTSVLTYHVVPGKVMAGDILAAKGARPATVNGQTVDVQVRKGKVYVNGAQVVTTDIVASNGVIHVIDAVLLPKPGAAASQ
jgi:uncharacterized surface protein with fasciclin (FAS1) repeats